ncbi:MAG: hypothetical protein NTV01_20235 [Bacteroidia bacterium]|nr:hypothetical protein [Bacteroidia bacterium]
MEKNQLTCPKCSNVFEEPLTRFLPFTQEQYNKVVQTYGKDFQICPKCKDIFKPNSQHKIVNKKPDSKIKIVNGFGETIEQSYTMAELEIPKDSTIIEKIVISEPIENTLDIELLDNQTAEEKLILLFGKGYTLKKSILKNESKKGFLGIGKKLKEYTITFSCPCRVQIKYIDNNLINEQLEKLLIREKEIEMEMSKLQKEIEKEKNKYKTTNQNNAVNNILGDIDHALGISSSYTTTYDSLHKRHKELEGELISIRNQKSELNKSKSS